jgi:D-proline reductase (dithiol) PrdB
VPPLERPFDPAVKGGDFSFRVLRSDANIRGLGEHHRSDAFEHAGILRDPNVAFPLERLRELAATGEIGDVAPRHLSFMGSITAPGRLATRTAPEAAQLLVEDGVDLALLFPV